MYKPQPKSLEQLKQERKEVMDKIINGAHLDFFSMTRLTKHLAEINKQILELEKEISDATANQ